MPAEPRVRAKRRDAARNRERILDMAERLFVTEGLEVGFHRIAGELGVGVGTVYRHLPDRDGLFLGVYERYQQHVEDVGEQFLEAEPGMRAYVLDSLRPVGAERPRLSEDALSMEDFTAITHQHDRV